MLLAILIHQGVPGGNLFRAVYFFPAVLSSVIVGSIFNVVLRFDGSLNALLKARRPRAGRLAGQSADRARQPDRRAALVDLRHERADLPRRPVDRVARTWSRRRGSRAPSCGRSGAYVIIPALRPIIEFVAVVTTIGVLTSMFGLIYVLTAGGPGTATTLPEFLIWLEQGKMNRPGYAAAISMVLFAADGRARLAADPHHVAQREPLSGCDGGARQGRETAALGWPPCRWGCWRSPASTRSFSRSTMR